MNVQFTSFVQGKTAFIGWLVSTVKLQMHLYKDIVFYHGYRTCDLWKVLEKKFHTNVLELKTVKYAILTFTFQLIQFIFK